MKSLYSPCAGIAGLKWQFLLRLIRVFYISILHIQKVNGFR